MSLLSTLFGDTTDPPQDPYWQRNPDLKYYRLLQISRRPQVLADKSGVFILWSQSPHGHWIYCAHAEDLEGAVEIVASHPEVISLESRHGLLFSWSPIRADLRDGVVAHLRATLPFALEDAALDDRLGLSAAKLAAAEPVPVLPPG
ncbi:hypothetical protein [Rhodospirillum rubrum]|uniref:Uncharacterized protein n=1 Tax=Rhodospirillum rubrum (strain ATCC 11170 / ATH 1.1.1 / DSM 467 / LMG 4362 / NCIMB 8255 / S1) TaxID=269796 RepID=Q2RPV3_RHORT|nr:hypothetical protein [Rhodospirillum rubrum]ABC23842.1 hypothetical protein Rru_A3047 [Rhodospirillum rubrum ATCC 11170]AEO49584.1 hypothetical protein F11_15610 [Rhodospirillum rubrum F11]MBK5955519.1 hypothetical protein [Rhodospirillum rubrum]QXG79790.1 hypothetical protein KUL73_15720 [Rhodospirillum rubrum]HAP98867.1 hypothetical protein [Rhodospirillum rubrum]